MLLRSYADGYLMFSEKELCIVTSNPDLRVPRIFKGYPQASEEEVRQEKHWAIRYMPIEQLQSIHKEQQIASMIVYVTMKTGESYRIAGLTNTYRKQLLTFEKLLNIFLKTGRFEQEEEEDSDEVCPKCGTMYPDANRKLCPRCMDRTSIFMRVLRYFKPYRSKVLLMLIC